MAFITDYELLNNAATSGNWTASGFDTPTLNDSAATTPIYLEGSACMWWPLKKGTTNGSVYTSTITGTPSFANRVVVGLLNYPFADIDLIPISAIRIRVASNTGFSTYYEWDAIAQLLAPYNTPISGHTPIIVYAANPDGSSGTYSANIESVGWTATTGSSADGKQGGFDFFFVIGWVGWHSGTLTNTFFSSIASECYDSGGGGLPGTNGRPIPIFSQSGNFFQTNVSIQLGHGTSDTANTVISETGKTIFFSNIEPEQELGYIFVDPASTYENRLTLADCVHFWTSQQSTHDIFTDATYATYFKIDGCSFSNGGGAELPAHTTDRWVKTSKFSSCGEIDIGDITFEDNIVANATSGVFYSGTGTRRAKNTTYESCTDAIHFDTAQTITLDGDSFSGNTTDIHFSGTGTLTIYKSNGANPTTSRVTGGGTVVFVDNPVTTEITVKDIETSSVIQGAGVLVWPTDSTNFPYLATVTITGTGTTATVAHTGHGLATGDNVIISGASPDVYNGAYSITVTGVNGYTYTTNETIASSPATGTIKSTFAFINTTTNASGIVSDTRAVSTDQTVLGWVRKASASPYYVQGAISGVVDNATGLTLTIQLVGDEG